MELLIFLGLAEAMVIVGLMMGFRSTTLRARLMTFGLAVAGLVLATWFLIGVAFY